jgi:hypothetical protein
MDSSLLPTCRPEPAAASIAATRDGWSTRLQPCIGAWPQCFVRLPVCISYFDAFNNSGTQNSAYTNGVTLSLPLCRIERNTTKIRGINETAVTNCPVMPNSASR